MKQYKLVNNLMGWLTFVIAAFTYCMTVEPTASFWDCPEFITTAYKLEVGHPPGAPFFMLTGNFFTQFTDDPTKVAYCVNIMSALLSALCILFLFWTITHLTRMLLTDDGKVSSGWQTALIMASGLCGALAYTWSDTFWFSAVEGEVYAYSSMFTALVFWLILKWEDHADEPHSDRYLILIFYLTGLSIGVHLLNLLCLPAIALVYYYKRRPDANLKGSLVALGVGMLLVAAVLYGVVPGIVKVGGWFEWFLVNDLGLPFNTGMILYLLLLVGVVLTAIWSTLSNNRTRTSVLYLLSVALLGIPFMGHGASSIIIGLLLLGAAGYLLHYQKDGQYLVRKRFLNTSLLCMLVLMIGYSSYAVIVIRSVANPPMDQNSPEDIFSLGTYLNREQYGRKPLLKGEAFCTQEQAYAAQAIEYDRRMRTQRKEKADASEDDSYEEIEETIGLKYPSGLTMFFPRMFSADHAAKYKQWMGDIDMKPVTFRTPDGYDMEGEMPTQLENIRFFLSYQVNFMYWRYFMWNFAGRQNDIQGMGESEHGNWITGIPFIDNAMYGDQSLLPDALKNNKGHNVFYCLPLLLGLLGLFWQAYRGEKGVRQFWVVFFLFFMTGLAIILYLNQTPSEPRERDYAYAGSFYAFAIWIGMGVAAIGTMLEKALKGKKAVATSLAALIGIAIPLQMVSQTWDDHDRSGRKTCRDFGLNYLNTLPEKGGPIIFTNGDNDTFPLWYNQEVEGNRTDARVCNLSYLQTDWYTDQMRRPAYDSPALPITWDRIFYVDNGKHTYYPIRPDYKQELDRIKQDNPNVDPYELSYVLDHYVKKTEGGFFPTDSVVVKVNKQAVIESGMMLPAGKDSIPDKMIISLKKALQTKGGLYRSDVMIYEMLAHADWKRPMYMSVTLGSGNYAGLENYLVLEGLAYRITPFNFGHQGVIDTQAMYHNMMDRFKYGSINWKGVYLDETTSRMCQTHRRMLIMLADNLLRQGKKAEALKVLQKEREVFPNTSVPYTEDDSQLPALWVEAGDSKTGAAIAKQVLDHDLQYLNYINSLGSARISTYMRTNYFLVASIIEVIHALEQSKDASAAVYTKRVENAARTEAFMSGFQVYQQQMQGAAAGE